MSKSMQSKFLMSTSADVAKMLEVAGVDRVIAVKVAVLPHRRRRRRSSVRPLIEIDNRTSASGEARATSRADGADPIAVTRRS